ncbi:THUMP-like domain-containing protein [Citricoccus sp.]|uniref:class I SAM-dependent methyltransferase n=1 Tax=Citricoccus sp. TaxID=1978372 RepID=UPI0028BEC3E7|nr:SAM-dependent methyltransferase [Citricoccus sp.]
MPVLTPEGWSLLNSLQGYRESEALALSSRLRGEGNAPELVSAVLTQLKFRSKAAAKFGPFAGHMVFTRAGLEQATRMNVAALHAGRFAAAGVESVADLGCGIGADSMALAALDLDVTAVERDETVAAAATINLMPFPNASVVCADAEEWLEAMGGAGAVGTDAAGADAVVADQTTSLPAPGQEPPSAPSADTSGRPDARPEGFWLDPARRVVSSSGSSRVFDPEAFSPPLSFVERLAGTGAPVGVKLGPALPHDSVPDGCEAQWVSVDGSLTEAVLWFNALARPGVRRAALVLGDGSVVTGGDGAPSAGGALPASDTESGRSPAELTSAADFGDSPAVPVAGLEGLADYLYEPGPAVIRAGLVADLIEREFTGVDGRLLDEHIAYFCADDAVDTPFATGYRVLAVMPYKVKGLRRWVKETGVVRLDIKKRGVDVTPEELRRLLMSGQGKGGRGASDAGKSAGGAGGARGKGAGRHATLVLTRIGEARVAVEVDPLP